METTESATVNRIEQLIVQALYGWYPTTHAIYVTNLLLLHFPYGPRQSAGDDVRCSTLGDNKWRLQATVS